jgi:GAF domain-containing protein
MTELQTPENNHDVGQGRRQLVQLCWGMRVAAMAGLGLFSWAYVPSNKLVPALLLSYLISLSVIQLGFAAMLRLYDRTVANHQRLATRSMRWQQLYTVNQRLMASPLNEGNLHATLASLAAINDARHGSLLLLDETGQTRQFVSIGLPPDVAPGVRPIPLSAQDAPLIRSNSVPWVEFLLPETKGVHSFIAVPIITGERLWGYLALADRTDDQPFTPQDQSLLQTFGVTLGVVLENAEFLQTTLRQVDLMAVLYQVGLATTSSLDIDAVLITIYEQCRQLMDVDAFYIALYEAEDQVITYPLFFDQGQRVAPFSLPADTGFAGWIVQNRQPFRCDDTVAEAESLPIEMHRTGGEPIRSYLGVPLLWRERVIGVISVQSYQIGAYGEAEVQLLTTLAAQAAVAIENALLFQETQQELAETAILAEVSHTISSRLTREELLPYLADKLARILDGTSCYIVLRAPHTGKLQPAAAYGPHAAQYQQIETDDELALARAVIETMRPIVVPDVNDSPYFSPETVEQFPDKSLLGLPLIVQGQAIGAAIIGESREKRHFDWHKVERGVVLANQVAVAITNAQLYSAEQREREVAQTLLQIAGDLSAALDLDKVLSLILERLRTVVPYESAAIGLLEGDVCYIAAAHDLPRARRLWGANLSPDELPLVARVLNGRTAVIVADTHLSDDWVTIEGSESIRSWLGVPLVVKDLVVGLLMLNHDTPVFYDQDAAQLALAFAQHAAVAIDNARLYAQAQVKLREQMLLYEMTTAISSTLDADRMLRLLAEQLVTMLDVTSTRIATLDDRGQTAIFVTQHCRTDQVHDETYDLTAFPITAEALMNRQPLLISGEHAPEEWHARLAQRPGQTMLFLPLIVRDRVTGLVEIADDHVQRRLGESEIALAQTLINQAAVAVDNARLFAETQSRLSELTLLYDIAVSATSTFDLDTVLWSVVKTLQFRVLPEAAVSVLILNEEQEELELRAHAGALEEVAYGTSLLFGQGIYQQVIRDGQPLLIGDARQDPRCAVYGPEVRSILCVPLLARGQQSLGVLQALSAQENAFSVHDRRLLRTMAGSLAIAIENVRLFSKLKRSEGKLKMRNWALRRTNERLRELDRLKSAFVATVSHELRTPLNAIIGFSEVLIDGLAGELPPLAEEYLNYIRSSGKHLLELINDILDLSKIQAGRLTLNLEHVNVVAVIVEDVQPTLTPLIDKKNQTFIVEPQGPLPDIVADRLRLKQILFNLISNALKFTPKGGRIEVRALLAAPDTLRLDVIDNGPGISVQDQSLIFKEFRQATQGTRRPGEGTGLGLSITRRLVELHGGRIWVESELGVSSTFIVLLPVSGPTQGIEGEEDGKGEG